MPWQAVQTTQLQGYTSDVEKLGTLVWARNTTGAWWPGEALDPHYLPPTRTIPPLAAAGESSTCFPYILKRRFAFQLNI